MKTMKMKVLSLALALALLLGLLPLAALAEDGEPAGYGLWVGGEEVTPDHRSGKGTDGAGTWTYEPDSKTLILEDYSYTGPGYRAYDSDDMLGACAVYYVGGDCLTIELRGDNSLTVTEGDTLPDYSACIYYDPDVDEDIEGLKLTITGVDDATLTLTPGPSASENCGIFSYFDLVLDGVTVKTEPVDVPDAAGGISAFGRITVYGARVDALAGSANDSRGIFAGAGLSIFGGEVFAEGADATMFSTGLYTVGELEVREDSLLLAFAGDASEEEGSYSLGIFALADVYVINDDADLDILTVVIAACGRAEHSVGIFSPVSTLTVHDAAVYGYGDPRDERDTPFGIIAMTPDFTGGDTDVIGQTEAGTGIFLRGIDGGNIDPVLGVYFDAEGEGAAAETYFEKAAAEEAMPYVRFAAWAAPSPAPVVDYGGAEVPTYPPILSETAHGSVSASPKAPQKGDAVTLTVTPDEGYELDSLTVTDSKGEPVELTAQEDGTYTFTQPAGKVTVEAAFREAATPLTLAELLEMFGDLDPEGWYLEDVLFCVDNGILEGMDSGEFAPDLPVSRAMAAQLLWNLAGRPEPKGEAPFGDVAPDAWYARAVAWAYEAGITRGTGTGFAPGEDVTREQLAVMLYNFARTLGLGFEGLWSFPLDFPDAGEVSSWAKEAVSWMVMNGVIRGTVNEAGETVLDPGGAATRAQLSAMVHRFCELIAE